MPKGRSLSRNRPLRWVLLTALAAIAFLARPGARQIVTSHEARVAQTARQMAAAGWPWRAETVAVAPVEKVVDAQGITRFQPQWDQPPIRVNPWLVPVMGGEIRLQKPPLPYWCAALLFRAAGVPWSEGLSRLTPALLGALATFFVYGLTRRTASRTAAWASALVWVSSYFIVEQFRLAMADPYLAFFTVAAMWAWVAAGQERRASLLLLFYVCLGLGLLAKGPPLFVPLGVGIVAYHLCLRRPAPTPVVGHATGIVIVLALTLPWVAYVWRAVPHVADVWRYESVGELPGGDNVEKARPLWFYCPNLFQITLPWTVVWAVGVAIPLIRWRVALRPAWSAVPGFAVLNAAEDSGREVGSIANRKSQIANDQTTPSPTLPWRTGRGRNLLFPLAWYFADVVFFSLMPVKKNTYLLPVMAAQAMIAGHALAAVMAIVRRFPRSAWVAWVQAAIGLGAASTALVLALTKVTADRPLAIAIAAVALAAAFGAIAELRARAGRAWAWRQSMAYVLAITALFAFWGAESDNRRSAKPVCDELVALMRQTGETLAPGKRPEEATLYLPLNLPVQLNAPTMLTIVDDPPHRTARAHGPARPDAERFADRVPWRTVTAAQRVDLQSAPGDDARWKVYRLTLAPP